MPVCGRTLHTLIIAAKALRRMTNMESITGISDKDLKAAIDNATQALEELSFEVVVDET